MAIFSENVKELIREKMISDSFWYDAPVGFSNHPEIGCFVTIHSGVQPLANNVNDNWATYNWSNTTFLGGVEATIVETSTSSFTIQATTSTLADRTGGATWAALWSRRLTPLGTSNQTLTTSSFTATSVPTSMFMIVPVSDVTTTTGVVRMNSTATVAGSAFTLSEITLTLGF